ncbi:UNVERIFIED_CONTAM: hypothetical protein FKN15_008635 [Acipenser sinensis]
MVNAEPEGDPHCNLLDQMLSELEEFLKILDKENLSSTAIVRKCLLTELLQTYMKSDGCDEEYIYMNKVIISSENQEQLVFERVLDQMLAELEEFLKILDKENLSSTAIVRKCLLSELLQTYMKSDGCDEEYIYMNKVIISSENQEQLVFERDDHSDSLTNGSLGKHSPAPQKSLPDLPRPRPCSDREPLPAPKLESPEGYYEEAQPYDTATNGMVHVVYH